MKFLAATLLVLLAYGGFSALTKTDLDPVTTGAIAPAPNSFTLHADNGRRCTLSHGGDLEDGLFRLNLGAECAAVAPDLAKAKYWREGEDCTVAFSSDGKDTIFGFGLADGDGYESFSPAGPLLDMTPAE